MKAQFFKTFWPVATTFLFATPLASASTIVLNFDDLPAMSYVAGTPIPQAAEGLRQAAQMVSEGLHQTALQTYRSAR